MTDGTRVVMPRLGESIVEATIVRWVVRPGDAVARGQTLAEVETDKATSEIPAPRAGVVGVLLAPEGATVPVGTPILEMRDEAPVASETPRPAATTISSTPAAAYTQTAQATQAAQRSSGATPSIASNGGARAERLPSTHLAPRGGPVRSSPAVRRLARTYAVNVAAIDGSGRGGRVTRDDVLKEIARGETKQNHPQGPAYRDQSPLRDLGPRSTPSSPPAISRAEATPFETALPAPLADHELQDPRNTRRAPAYRAPVYAPQPNDRTLPFSRRREQISGHMVHSLHTAAHVFALAEIDMSRVISAKNKDAPFADRSGVKLTFMPYVIAAVARALTEHPELNATVGDNALIIRGDKNIGVAVDTEEGLVVPVVKRADELGLIGLARAVSELSERARTGKLTPTDLAGGSFTISNPGKDGNLYGVSIIRQPEVAILRIGSIVKRAVVREIEGEDAIVVRPMMYAALSYDHRVIDGRKGNAFLTRINALLATQTPQLG